MYDDMTLAELECLNVRQSSRLSRAYCAGDWMTAEIVEEILRGLRHEIWRRRRQQAYAAAAAAAAAAAVKAADPQP